MKKRRSLFAELKEGMDALAAEREGKVTLRKTMATVLNKHAPQSGPDADSRRRPSKPQR